MKRNLGRESRFRGLFLAVLLGAVAIPHTLSAEEGALPEWVQNRPFEDGVLFGFGQAPVALGPAAMGFARGLAFGEVASQLNVAIEQESELSLAAFSMAASGVEPDGSTVETSYDATMEEFFNRVKTRTAVPFLPGASIYRQETVGSEVYLLVRMPVDNFRTAAVARLTEIDRLLARAQHTQPEDVESVRVLRMAYAAAVERQSLAILAAGVQLSLGDPPVDPALLRARCGFLMEPLVFRLVGADRAPALAETVRAAADELGITIAEGNAPARFQFTLRSRERVRQQGDWHRASVTASVAVTHLPTGQSLGQFRHAEDKASTQSAEEALARSYEAIDEPMLDQIVERLFRMIAKSDAGP